MKATRADDDQPFNSYILSRTSRHRRDTMTAQGPAAWFVIVRACCPAAQATSFRATAQGWFVTATTLSQVLPLAFIDRGDVRASSGMGIMTLLFLTNPTVKPV